jgi:hypothetical protein
VNRVAVESVEEVADPLSVKVHPIPLVGQVSQQVLSISGQVQEILNCQPLDLRYCRYFHLVSTQILHMSIGNTVNTYILLSSHNLLEKVNVGRIDLG